MLKLEYFLLASAALFAIGMFGVLSRRHVVQILLSIELLLNAANINFVAFSTYVFAGAAKGLVFAIFVITLAAAEVGVGLAIIIAIYRSLKTSSIDDLRVLKW